MKKTDAAPEKGTLQTLDDWWFGHGSPTSLGVFRMIFGSLVFISLIMVFVDWDAWFSERGYVPAWLGRLWLNPDVPLWPGVDFSIPRIGILNGITNGHIAVTIYLATIFFAFTTMLGLWTRASTILLAVGLVSMHHRNAIILHGGDTVMRVMVLYLALAPCGKACSLDRLIRLWKGKDTGVPITVSLWPQRLIMYNMALIYFTTTWLKWFGNLWKPPIFGGEMTANWFPARLAEFYRFPYPEFLRDTPMVYITTAATLVIEFSLATLVFYRPFRKWVLLAGLGLHGFIDYTMNIPLFSFLMVSMYITFYDGEEVSAWFQRLGQKIGFFRATVHLPKGRRFDPRGAAFFDSVDPLKVVTYVPGDREELAPKEIGSSWTHSLGGWLFGWIPGVWRNLMNRALEPMPEAPEPEISSKKGKRLTSSA
ncbi:MAG: HTTM domain-containing protein [Fimbriimonas sp.]